MVAQTIISNRLSSEFNPLLRIICNSIHSLAITAQHTTASSSIVNSSAAISKWPERVNNFYDLISESFTAREKPPFVRGDKHHWFVTTGSRGFEFATEKDLLDFYARTLATVFASEKEAKQKIYLVSLSPPFGYGAEIDEDTQKELKGSGSVAHVSEDCCYAVRNKNPSVQSAARFTSLNKNHRFDNIFSYHHLSERNSEWKSDHWLIIPKEPDEGFNDSSQVIRYFIKLLAEVVGSENEAKEKIYIIWHKLPFGFGAKIDAETSNKLKGLPDVLEVLPDYAFDLKRDDEALIISHSSDGITFCYYCLSGHEDSDSEDWENSLEEHVDASDDSTGSALKFDQSSDPYMIVHAQRVVCKHWFIGMQKPSDEFASVQQSIDFYIQILATVVGSVKEAKAKIYRVIHDSRIFGFGGEIDVRTALKLKGVPGVVEVLPDYLFDSKEVYQGIESSDSAAKKMKL